DFDDTTKGFTKKELLIKKRELDKLHKSLGGIRNLTKTPSALWVVDTKKEHLAVDEARKLGIPIIAILDTNCDPDEVHYPIPGNDDAIRSVALLTRIIADAAAEGLIQRHQKPEDGATTEPLAEWEAELLGTTAATADAVQDAPAAAVTADDAEAGEEKPAAKTSAKVAAKAEPKAAAKKTEKTEKTEKAAADDKAEVKPAKADKADAKADEADAKADEKPAAKAAPKAKKATKKADDSADEKTTD